MSGVRKWYIGVFGGEAQARTCSPHPNEVIRDREGDTFVLSRDHMAALASSNADKEAYAQNAIDLRKRVDTLQQRLTAADELNDTTKAELAWQESDNAELRKRVDVLEGLLRRAKPYIPWNRFGSVQYQWNLEVQDALKPTEGGDDET